MCGGIQVDIIRDAVKVEAGIQKFEFIIKACRDQTLFIECSIPSEVVAEKMIVIPSVLLIGINAFQGDSPSIFILFTQNRAEVNSQAEITLIIIPQNIIAMGFKQHAGEWLEIQCCFRNVLYKILVPEEGTVPV